MLPGSSPAPPTSMRQLTEGSKNEVMRSSCASVTALPGKTL
ncbi:Uncharacterised protein [Bordetella pertussis]|nr:Uncharacterised protein [Bordetella pertussis]CFO29714.1 Uncharacterised protein [Bordetella pertussis]CFO99007.1 Uncharacterised protein [Bordetella pertussis]CFT93198.1 Uncharacterised protein [Bordetella pertussis]CPI92398.1 Uncharacterised protein [Bordetella pertussis]